MRMGRNEILYQLAKLSQQSVNVYRYEGESAQSVTLILPPLARIHR